MFISEVVCISCILVPLDCLVKEIAFAMCQEIAAYRIRHDAAVLAAKTLQIHELAQNIHLSEHQRSLTLNAECASKLRVVYVQ